MSILIIDDSPDQRNLVHMMLNSAGYPDIHSANSAATAMVSASSAQKGFILAFTKANCYDAFLKECAQETGP